MNTLDIHQLSHHLTQLFLDDGSINPDQDDLLPNLLDHLHQIQPEHPKAALQSILGQPNFPVAHLLRSAVQYFYQQRVVELEHTQQKDWAYLDSEQYLNSCSTNFGLVFLIEYSGQYIEVAVDLLLPYLTSNDHWLHHIAIKALAEISLRFFDQDLINLLFQIMATFCVNERPYLLGNLIHRLLCADMLTKQTLMDRYQQGSVQTKEAILYIISAHQVALSIPFQQVIVDDFMAQQQQPTADQLSGLIYALQQTPHFNTQTIPVLLENLNSDQYFIRSAAIETLAHLGYQQPDFLNVLKTALFDFEGYDGFSASRSSVIAIGQFPQHGLLFLNDLNRLLAKAIAEQDGEHAVLILQTFQNINQYDEQTIKHLSVCLSKADTLSIVETLQCLQHFGLSPARFEAELTVIFGQLNDIVDDPALLNPRFDAWLIRHPSLLQAWQSCYQTWLSQSFED